MGALLSVHHRPPLPSPLKKDKELFLRVRDIDGRSFYDGSRDKIIIFKVRKAYFSVVSYGKNLKLKRMICKIVSQAKSF
jgi:hypothetical protein